MIRCQCLLLSLQLTYKFCLGRNLVGPMEMEYSPERGMFVKNLQYEICRNPGEAVNGRKLKAILISKYLFKF